MNDLLTPPKLDLKTAVLKRIETDRVCPRSRWFFRSRECVVWSLWVVTVVIGSLALAVTLYVLSLRQYALYEATHDTFFTFVVEVLPYLWLLTFSIMVGVAVYNLRHTARGYRYPLWLIASSSLALSIVGGVGLHLASVGFMIDKSFGEFMPTYESQAKLERRLWQVPEDGRLLGRYQIEVTEENATPRFIDFEQQVWTLSLTELDPLDVRLLESGQLVRLLGLPIDPSLASTKVFHACGAYPWHFEKPMPMKDLALERAVIMERINSYKEKIVRGIESRQSSTSLNPDLATATPCMNIVMMRRLERP